MICRADGSSWLQARFTPALKTRLPAVRQALSSSSTVYVRPCYGVVCIEDPLRSQRAFPPAVGSAARATTAPTAKCGRANYKSALEIALCHPCLHSHHLLPASAAMLTTPLLVSYATALVGSSYALWGNIGESEGIYGCAASLQLRSRPGARQFGIMPAVNNEISVAEHPSPLSKLSLWAAFYNTAKVSTAALMR